MKRFGLYFAGALLGLSASSVSFAAANGYYAGLGAGWTTSEIATTDTTTAASSVKKTGTGGKLFAGYQVNENFALEGDYLYFGKQSYTSSTAASNGKVKTQALTANIVGILPLAEQFNATVKAGVFRSLVTKDAGMLFASSQVAPKNRWGFDYGIGVNYFLTPNTGVGLSWDQLLRDQKQGLLSANLTYNFG